MSEDRVWIVQRGEAGPLHQRLACVDTSLLGAVSDGRVFVDGVRANDLGHQVQEGSRIEVRARRALGDSCAILGQRGALVAAFKPARIPTEPDRRGGSDCLVTQVAALLDCPPRMVHAASRLDIDVSGIVILATSAKACSHLEDSRRAGSFRKFYLAIAAKAPTSLQGTWDTPLPDKGSAGSSQSARTRYLVVATAGVVAPRRDGEPAPEPQAALLELEAVTGRFHQLRRHCSVAGCALLGDTRYAGPRRIVRSTGSVVSLNRVALHAACIALPDLDRNPWIVTSPLPAKLVEIWQACDGETTTLRPMSDRQHWHLGWFDQ